MNKISNIKTRNDLADFLGIPLKKMTHILYKQGIDNSYYSFTIPKKNGDPRSIDSPNEDLKSIQRKIKHALWKVQKELNTKNSKKTNISHAFEKDKSIITNAVIHRNKRFVLNIDLKDFFESFHFGRVKGFFEKNHAFKFSNEVATIIAQLVCYKQHLPQGAPSSPIITNLICNILDFRLLKISQKYKLNYTRYADDLTFSTNNKYLLINYEEIYEEIAKEIEQAGFIINENKTRLQFRDSKQQVTGLVVNKKLNVDRTYSKKTRAMAYSLYKNGNFEINNEPATINQLEGRFAFINQLDKYNNKSSDEKHDFKNLNSREKQYQKFLYYKYFYANEKPLIVTEGKTDIRYLKAALKNLYADYPDLITKKNTNEFEFKISFLRRSNRLFYFLNIALDGADTIQNIYNFSTTNGDSRYSNYLAYFNNFNNSRPKNPVILVFDHEIDSKENKDKPLKKFLTQKIKWDENTIKEFQHELMYNIIDNLYLLTNPILVKTVNPFAGEKGEFEIEHLFKRETLNVELNGMTFSLDDKYNSKIFYGKDTFSKYVESNYKTIDFNEFKPMLNSVSKILREYNLKKQPLPKLVSDTPES